MEKASAHSWVSEGVKGVSWRLWACLSASYQRRSVASRIGISALACLILVCIPLSLCAFVTPTARRRHQHEFFFIFLFISRFHSVSRDFDSLFYFFYSYLFTSNNLLLYIPLLEHSHSQSDWSIARHTTRELLFSLREARNHWHKEIWQTRFFCGVSLRVCRRLKGKSSSPADRETRSLEIIPERIICGFEEQVDRAEWGKYQWKYKSSDGSFCPFFVLILISRHSYFVIHSGEWNIQKWISVQLETKAEKTRGWMHRYGRISTEVCPDTFPPPINN